MERVCLHQLAPTAHQTERIGVIFIIHVPMNIWMHENVTHWSRTCWKQPNSHRATGERVPWLYVCHQANNESTQRRVLHLTTLFILSLCLHLGWLRTKSKRGCNWGGFVLGIFNTHIHSHTQQIAYAIFNARTQSITSISSAWILLTICVCSLSHILSHCNA